VSTSQHSPLDQQLDALESAPPARGGIPCAVARIMSELPPETAERIRHLVDETEVQATAIAETLTAAGHPVNYQSVTRHRRRLTRPGSGCRCEP